jgi:hypothetical protein
LSEGEKIDAILKYRFTDFIVNEIEPVQKEVLFLDNKSAITDKTFDREMSYQK